MRTQCLLVSLLVFMILWVAPAFGFHFENYYVDPVSHMSVNVNGNGTNLYYQLNTLQTLSDEDPRWGGASASYESYIEAEEYSFMISSGWSAPIQLCPS